MEVKSRLRAGHPFCTNHKKEYCCRVYGSDVVCDDLDGKFFKLIEEGKPSNDITPAAGNINLYRIPFWFSVFGLGNKLADAD